MGVMERFRRRAKEAPAAGTVPILGQPCTFRTFVPTVMVTCNCDAHVPLLLVGMGGTAFCPACQNGVRLNGVMWQGERISLQITPVTAPSPAPEGASHV